MTEKPTDNMNSSAKNDEARTLELEKMNEEELLLHVRSLQ
jgi:hypothetical protein